MENARRWPRTRSERGIRESARLGRSSWYTVRHILTNEVYCCLTFKFCPRGLAIRFPLLSAIASAGIFFLILSLILGTCVLPLLLPTPQADKEEDESSLVEPKRRVSSTSPRSPSPTSDKETRRRRRSRGSRERSVRRMLSVPHPLVLI